MSGFIKTLLVAVAAGIIVGVAMIYISDWNDERKASLLPETQNPENTTDFAGGLGTAEQPYLISTPDQLARIGSKPSASFRLISDIDLYGKTWSPIPVFQGHLDGNGKTISNMSIAQSISALTSDTYVGMFKEVLPEATISDVSLVNTSITVTGSIINSESAHSTNYQLVSGALVGKNSGTIQNCLVDATLSITFTGRWTNFTSPDYDEASRVYNRFGTIVISGGIAGINTNSGIIKESVTSGSIAATYNQTGGDNDCSVYNYAGGITGLNDGGIIQSTTSSAAVSLVSNFRYTGATLVGTPWQPLGVEPYMHTYAGGSIGLNYSGTVTQTISTGARNTSVLIEGTNYWGTGSSYENNYEKEGDIACNKP